MYRERKKRKIILIVLGLLLCVMGIGYSAFYSQLRIAGTTNIASNWDVRISNISTPTINGSAEEVINPTCNVSGTPKSCGDGLNVDMEVDLYEVGDSVEYDVTITNFGSIDATLDDFTIGSSEALKITVTGVTKGQTIYKNSHNGDSVTAHVKIEYNPSYTDGEVSEEVSVNFEYSQAEVKELDEDEVISEDKYLVSYDCEENGGVSCSNNNEYLTSGSSVDLTKTAIGGEYAFVGWNTNKDVITALSSLNMGSSNITLYAIYSVVPTYIEYVSKYNTTTVVEITFPEKCSNGTYTCTYKKDNDSAVTVDSSNLVNNKISVEFTDSGTLISTVSDGTNTVSSSYTVSMETLQVTANYMLNKLGQNVVTSGDGLYEDSASNDDVAYLYRGANPNNYINIGSDTYRIMSIDTSGNLKVIKDVPILNSNVRWDFGKSYTSTSSYTRYSSSSTNYCYLSTYSAYYGCNAWGSRTSTLNSSGTEVVTQMPAKLGGALKNLPVYDAYINVYLNGGQYPYLTSTPRTITSWYSTNVDSSVQDKMITHLWNVGHVGYSSSNTITQDIENEGAYKWSGKVGLMTTTEFVRASSKEQCVAGKYSYVNDSSCYYNDPPHNWLYKDVDEWMMGPLSSTNTIYVEKIKKEQSYDHKVLGSGGSADSKETSVRPVFYLSACVFLTGTGTLDDPFEVEDVTTCDVSSSDTYNANNNASQIPTLSTTHTTNSITAVMNTSNVIGEITKYEFSKDKGLTWEESNSNVYEFTSLVLGTYKVLGRVTTSNGVVLTTIYSRVTLESLSIPTFSDEYNSSNRNVYGDITITYPAGCGSVFTCTYTKDSNSPVTVTTTSVTVRYTSDGELSASVSDGTNTVGSSFTVILPEEVEMNGVYVLTSLTGDGLYTDNIPDDDVAYLYRGGDPNNYITLGSDTYRIMSIDTSGNLKVIKATPLSSREWDLGYSTDKSGITSASSTEGTRYSSSESDYCYKSSDSSYKGCKSWGSSTSTLNSAGTSSVTQMPWEAGSSTLYDLPTYDTYINVYLNGGVYPTTSGTTTLTSWYSTNVDSSVQGKMVDHLWNVGPVNDVSSLSQNIEQEAAYKWRGKVGLMTATDFVRASTNPACTNVGASRNTKCYNDISTHNWLHQSQKQWTISPYSSRNASYMGSMWETYYGRLTENVSGDTVDVYPVFYLSSSTSISGSGTSGSPFTVS